MFLISPGYLIPRRNWKQSPGYLITVVPREMEDNGYGNFLGGWGGGGKQGEYGLCESGHFPIMLSMFNHT